jgi:hypothetical protein
MSDSSQRATKERGQSGLLFLGVLVVLEVGVLYLLIAVESPLSPLVRKLLRNGFGIFALVMLVVTLLGFAMAFVLRLVEGRRRATIDPPAG